MAPANVAYTSFLLATAAAGGPLEITAAILPCSWSYIEIARGLKDQLAEHPVYADWVGFYLQEEEADLVKNMRETFDQMTRREVMSDDRRSQLGEIFTMSSRLEGMFWEMVYTLDQWPDLAPPDQASLAFTPVLRRRRPGRVRFPRITPTSGREIRAGPLAPRGEHGTGGGSPPSVRSKGLRS